MPRCPAGIDSYSICVLHEEISNEYVDQFEQLWDYYGVMVVLFMLTYDLCVHYNGITLHASELQNDLPVNCPADCTDSERLLYKLTGLLKDQLNLLIVIPHKK